MTLSLPLLSGLLALPLVSAAPLTGINVGSADLPRVDGWVAWTGETPDIIGDILFAKTWDEFAGDVPGVGVDFSLNLHVPPAGSPPNPHAAAQLELSIPLFPDQDTDGTYYSSIPDRLARGAAGDYDVHWRRLAEKLVARGLADVWLRPGWEMNIPDPLTQGYDNGGWLIGNSSVAKHQDFAAYWRRFHDAMMSVPGADFQWTFCLLAGIETMASAQQVLDHAYPGDAYVDFISSDVYDGSNYARYFRGNWQRFGESWLDQVSMPERDDRTWDELGHGIRRDTGLSGNFVTEIPSLDRFRQFARERGKPFMISEWGLRQVDRALPSLDQPGDPIDGGNDNPEFVANVANWVEENDVFAVVYFDFYLARQNPLYGESRTNYVDSALMNDHWHELSPGGSLHPSSQPSPRAAATYLTAFHGAPASGIPTVWKPEGRKADAPLHELAADGLTWVETGGPQGAGWAPLAGGGESFESTGPGSLLERAPLAEGGGSTYLCTAELRAPVAGAWAGLRFGVGQDGSGGYAFEALCGDDGLPELWRLRRNGAAVWFSEREPLLSRLEGRDWRTEAIPMAVRVKPGPGGTSRIEMFFGADTAGHFNDPSPLAIPAEHRFGVVADRAGAAAAELACYEYLVEEDFEDGAAENFTDGGWVERRLHYRADPTAGEKQALAGSASDRAYRLRAKVGMTRPGRGGLTLLHDAAGDAYRVELVCVDLPEAKDMLAEIQLKRVGGDPATLASWAPTGAYFLGGFNDLEVAAEPTPAGDLRLSVRFNELDVIEVIEPDAGDRAGRFGPWAASESDVSIDDFAALPISEIVTGGESYELWAARKFGTESDPEIIGAESDPDGDGLSNADERLTGTDPLDGGSAWRIRPGPGGIWQAGTLPGRRYRWEASDTLEEMSWLPVGGWISGDGLPLDAPIVVDRARRFYRLAADWE